MYCLGIVRSLVEICCIDKYFISYSYSALFQCRSVYSNNCLINILQLCKTDVIAIAVYWYWTTDIIKAKSLSLGSYWIAFNIQRKHNRSFQRHIFYQESVRGWSKDEAQSAWHQEVPPATNSAQIISHEPVSATEILPSPSVTLMAVMAADSWPKMVNKMFS